MTALIDFIIIFATSFGFNLIPFAGPSNLLIASTAAIGLANPGPAALLTVAVLIALGAALAKGIHYLVTFFVSGKLSEKRRQRLDADSAKIKRWAFLLLFAAAASPIPDEPIVIPLGLMKYSPAKFFCSYFLGKLSIALVGVFLGEIAGDFLANWFSPTESFILSIVVSIILTIIITYIILKVDLAKLAEKYLHRKPKPQATQQKP
ncbi:MAG: VTT domain-containing protein [Candidatus Bathyarchaeota archaeon]|nr:VTT domain-containing protein [Candidatus Bathyarchaeota archaeon]